MTEFGMFLTCLNLGHVSKLGFKASLLSVIAFVHARIAMHSLILCESWGRDRGYQASENFEWTAISCGSVTLHRGLQVFIKDYIYIYSIQYDVIYIYIYTTIYIYDYIYIQLVTSLAIYLITRHTHTHIYIYLNKSILAALTKVPWWRVFNWCCPHCRDMPRRACQAG